jgi:ATP-dependent Clp protease ATP-binding subunit ClpB
LFKPLQKDEIIKIIDLSLKEVGTRLEARKITLDVDQEAKKFIADSAYSPLYGARPVKRYMQKYIETEVAKRIIRGEAQDNSVIRIDHENGGLAISIK